MEGNKGILAKAITRISLGMLVMISALTMGGCSIRTVLKTAYLDITSAIGLIMIGVGVFVGCQVLKRLVYRS